MPRKALFKKEEVVQKAFEIVRANGIEALSARSLARALGSSSRPIFTLFKSMEDVHSEVREKALQVFNSYVADVSDYLPAFKEYGRRLVTFANFEVQLFRLLFLHNLQTYETMGKMTSYFIDKLSRTYDLTHQEAMTLLSQCWTYICGMATINNNRKETFTNEEIYEMLGRQFVSTLFFIKSGKRMINIIPRKRTSEDDEIAIDFTKL